MSFSNRNQLFSARVGIANATPQIESVFSAFQFAMEVLSIQSDLPEHIDTWMQQGISLATILASKLEAKEGGGKCLR